MEEDHEVDDGSGIVKAMSAYHHYSKHASSLVKDELLKEGKDTSMGVIVSVVSARWRSLGAEEKAKFEKLAAEDRDRYNKECAIRDEEVLRQQEERRKAHAVGAETDTRMRHSTVAHSDVSALKAEAPTKKREMSREEQEKIDSRRQAKNAETSAINSQLESLKKERVAQAEARLKYLLSQSDIFSHFGAVKTDTTGTSANNTAGLGGGSSKPSAANLAKGASSSNLSKSASSSNLSKSRRRNRAASDELDDDERAMAREEDDEDGEGEGGGALKTTVLKKQPSCITGGAMRDYQLEGLNWMIRLQDNGINGILADEMGLGKTLQSISIVGYLHEFKQNSGPHLVMVPKSTLSNWCNEFKRWCPVIRVLRFHGSKEERQEIVDEQLKPARQGTERDWDVCITTYEVVNLEKNSLTKIAWDYLIIDEAHRLKNEASQFSTTVRMLNTRHRLLLTGTPLQNNLHELWALLNFLLPDIFASAEQFDDWFNLDVDDNEAKQRMIGQLHKLLRPFMLRRLKADVEKSLPPKSETILFTGMSAVQKDLYRKVLMRDIDMLNGGAVSNSNGSRTAILNIVMQLRKCCNHPYLFPNIEDRTQDPMGEHLYQNCGKMVLLHKLLGKMKERGHRVLIFSQMTRMIDILEDYMISQGYQYCRIDGNTTYEDREDRIADFNREGSDKFIFVLSTRAGGLGINLQTADTVILYDSDWNPQADLQAQDRAHRIGQKKPVQVFRLVTDETVEVKVVERAQQKLKLDAMVVQQGRLQEKEKKMTKQDLLDTLRFGADKIFRSKDSNISDADIDLILEEGRKRTEELTEKLTKNDTGDMYDFRLDGGMSTQVFEGIDYSNKLTRDQELMAMAGISFIDTGKRERKPIASYVENPGRAPAQDDGDKRQKLPRHLRLNRMDDWQFFDKARLNELQAEEIRLFDILVEKGEAPQAGNIGKFVVLPADLQEEKTQLLAAGFGDWTRVHLNNFVRASAKHGRHEYEKIAKDVGRPVEETKRYSLVFWERGAAEMPPAEWERVTKQIEKGEKRLEEIGRLTSATAKLITMFEDPWEELTFRNVGNQGRIFNAVEDRFLLCLTHLHGYGSWDQVRNSVRRCERFRFDFYLQSCSADALGKRCELLMRSAERELLEIERKRQAADAPGGAAASAKLKSAGDVVKERLSDLTKQIAEESKRLANTRSQLQKLKSSNSMVMGTGTGVTVNSTSGATTSAGIMKAFLGGGTAAASNGSGAPTKEGGGKSKKASSSAVAASVEGSTAGEGKAGHHAGAVAAVVPEGSIPELCRLIQGAGQDGINKLVASFLATHPNVSKRQAEIKINEVAVKEKRAADKYIIWHLRPEYEQFVNMSPEEAVAAAAALPPSENAPAATSSAKKRKAEPEPAEEENGHGSPAANGASAGAGGDGKEPRRYKRAFGFFVKDKRAEAEAQLGSSASVTDALRNLLTAMWEQTEAEDRAPYEKKEQDDRARYEREMQAWEASKASQTTAASSSSSGIKKKKKVEKPAA